MLGRNLGGVISSEEWTVQKFAAQGDLSHQKLDRALLHAVRKLPPSPPSSSAAAVADQPSPYRRCVELLLSKAAKLSGADVQQKDHEAMAPIVTELIQKSLVPDHANKAMVDLAQTVSSGRKRTRERGTDMSEEVSRDK
jgi:hypothetical protein